MGELGVAAPTGVSEPTERRSRREHLIDLVTPPPSKSAGKRRVRELKTSRRLNHRVLRPASYAQRAGTQDRRRRRVRGVQLLQDGLVRLYSFRNAKPVMSVISTGTGSRSSKNEASKRNACTRCMGFEPATLTLARL